MLLIAASISPYFALKAKGEIKDSLIIEDTTINNSNSLLLASGVIKDSISYHLLNNDSIFKNYWDNQHLFVYKSVKISDLPDLITLRLLKAGENFKLTWHGVISSGYGQRWGRKHEGLDLPLHTGDSVLAAFDGIIRFAQYTNSGYGNCIIIRHLNGLETLYGHLSKIDVVENQFIKCGQLIGLGGSTGKSTGPHLHFETRLNDYSFDPSIIINLSSQSLYSDSITISKKTLFAQRYEPITIMKKSTISKKLKNKKSIHSVEKTKKLPPKSKIKTKPTSSPIAKSKASKKIVSNSKKKSSNNKNVVEKKKKPAAKKTNFIISKKAKKTNTSKKRH